ncbi:MAG: phosphoribosylglycinamide formyltransferase 2, partial [Steroidobacteraceae bacterium]
SQNVRFENVERALTQPDTALRLFGKPEVQGHRRMGVSLALGATLDEARQKARDAASAVLEGVQL